MVGRVFATLGLLVAVLAGTSPAHGQEAFTDPLPSWKHGATKQRIVEFVEATTRPDSPQFVRTADQIAVFDNDGTLWAEQPVYRLSVVLPNSSTKCVARSQS
jgi:hypothetical protein